MNDSPKLLFAMYFFVILKFIDKINLLDGILTSLDVDYTSLAKTTHFWDWYYILIQCRVNRSSVGAGAKLCGDMAQDVEKKPQKTSKFL